MFSKYIIRMYYIRPKSLKIDPRQSLEIFTFRVKLSDSN